MKVFFVNIAVIVFCLLTFEFVINFLEFTPYRVPTLSKINKSSIGFSGITIPKESDLPDWEGITIDPKFWTEYDMHLPSAKTKVVLHTRLEKKLIYSVDYSTDDLGRRKTVSPKKSKKPKGHLIISGCSFVFGEGLKDHETLPSALQARLPEYKVYNIGRSGGAPNTLLFALNQKQYTFLNDIEPDNGFFFFVVIDSHVGRAVGSMQFLRSDPWGWLKPDYEFENGEAIYKGKFEDSRNWLYKIMVKSLLLGKLGISFPSEGSHSVQKTAKMIQQIKMRIHERLPGTRFIAVLHPSAKMKGDFFAESFKKLGIEYADYSHFEIQKTLNGKAYLLDGHPSALGNEMLSDLIVRDVIRNPN